LNKVNFLFIPDYVKQITCMKVSPNKKHLVICEQHHTDPNQCFMSVYDMKNLKEIKNVKPHMNITQIAENKDATSKSKGAAARMKAKNLLDPAATQNVFGDKKTAKEKEMQPKIITDFSFSQKGHNQYIVLVMSNTVESRVVVLDWSGAIPRVEAV
jgi:hypothetical protein